MPFLSSGYNEYFPLVYFFLALLRLSESFNLVFFRYFDRDRISYIEAVVPRSRMSRKMFDLILRSFMILSQTFNKFTVHISNSAS